MCVHFISSLIILKRLIKFYGTYNIEFENSALFLLIELDSTLLNFEELKIKIASKNFSPTLKSIVEKIF